MSHDEIHRAIDAGRFELSEEQVVELLTRLVNFEDATRQAHLALHYESVETCFDALVDHFALDRQPAALGEAVIEQARQDEGVAHDPNLRASMATCVRMALRFATAPTGLADDPVQALLRRH